MNDPLLDSEEDAPESDNPSWKSDIDGNIHYSDIEPYDVKIVHPSNGTPSPYSLPLTYSENKTSQNYHYICLKDIAASKGKTPDPQPYTQPLGRKMADKDPLPYTQPKSLLAENSDPLPYIKPRSSGSKLAADLDPQPYTYIKTQSSGTKLAADSDPQPYIKPQSSKKDLAGGSDPQPYMYIETRSSQIKPAADSHPQPYSQPISSRRIKFGSSALCYSTTRKK